MPGKSLATNLKRKRRALNDSQRLVQTSLDQDVPPLPPPRPGVRTHTVVMGLMALGHEGAPRRRLLAELRRAWAHHAPYDASQDEITRPLEDPPSLIPAVYLTLRLLLNPSFARRTVARTVDNYSLSEAAVQVIRQIPADVLAPRSIVNR